MDALSRLLSLYPLSTTLDVRCHFGAPWVLEHAAVASGIAPYHLVVSGTAWLDAEGQTGIALAAGDIVVFPKGSAHRLYTGAGGDLMPQRHLPGPQVIANVVNDGSGAPTDILCGQFEFNSDSANPLLLALPDIVLVRSSGRPDFSGLQALSGMLRQETDSQRAGASAVVAQLSSALFALVLRAWLEQAEAVPGLFALLADQRLQAALQGMLAAPEKPWTLQDMASACHMSRATFARVFQRVAGMTPAALLMQTRMAQAAVWLAQGKRTVADIGEAVGYQSEAASNRVFKRCFAVGPGQYRRNARADNA
ncbi:AraC family transcriptional regulator [Collimonas sp.]|jgi:AraC family transcriptional activator of mtrCDE|uniref:AraC family transcriptional regulator n=1 Tax=Collimonas sp. TaxID=1963772 RepID=UPI002D0EC6E6|nr:AraC family transcriptional regulator [Collimonas sp.]HWX03880.1 AraC family transcriptional regulator [Collimonas sp.]